MADDAGTNPLIDNRFIRAVTLSLALTQADPATANTPVTPVDPQALATFQSTTQQLETEVLNLSTIIIDTLRTDVTRLQQSPTSSATELENYTERLTQLEQAIAPLRQNGADQTWDANTDVALNAFVEELQNGGLGYALPNDAVLRTGWDRLKDGGYSMDYHVHLNAMLETMDQGMRAIAQRQTEGETLTEQERQNFYEYRAAYNELSGFFYAMDDLKSQGFVEFAPNQPTARGTIEYPQALKIIDTALASMQNAGLNYFQPQLGDDTYDMESRRATQALIIELSSDLGLENSDGRMTQQFRQALSRALQDETKRDEIARKYLNDDLSMVQRFSAAFNTIELESPRVLAAGQPQHISQNTLIYRPDFKSIEISTMTTSLSRVPETEIAAITHFSAIMTGFGLENLLPDGTLSQEQMEAIQSTDRTQAFSNLFASAHGASDGSADGITAELVTRFNAVYNDIPAYSAYHKIQMRADLREAAEAATAIYADTQGSAQEKLNAAGAAFAAAMPQHENFINDHGLGRRSIIPRGSNGIDATTPVYPIGFAISPATAEPGQSALDAALGAPTIDAITAQIRQSYDGAVYHEYAGHAGHTRSIGESRLAFDQSPQALATWETVQESLTGIRASITGAYGERTQPAIIQSSSGENFLASRNESGELEIRYLDEASLAGLDSGIETIQVDAHLNMDDVLTQGAYATYQARNENDSDSPSNQKVTFFRIGDKAYVGGIDSQTSMFQIHEIDPEFFSADNARIISSAQTRREAYQALSEQNPAYAFMRNNYAGIYNNGANRDDVFDTMAQFIGTTEAQEARLLANAPADAPGVAPSAEQEQTFLAAREDAIENATPQPPRRTVEPYRGPAPEIEKIAFIMDKNPDNPDSLDTGVYVKVDSRIEPMRNVEMSAREIAELEAATGINLDEQMRLAFQTPETDVQYHQQSSRFFVLAIHPDHETVRGGLVIGYADDDGNTKYGFMPSDEFDIRNHFDLSGMLQAQYIRPDSQGYDRLHILPRDDNHIINSRVLQGMFVDTDGSTTGPDRFDLVHAAMNRANWIGDGYHRPYEERVANGSQFAHTPHGQTDNHYDFRDNANSVTRAPDEIVIGTGQRAPQIDTLNPTR